MTQRYVPIACAVFVGSVALLAVDVFYGFWDHDSGYFLEQAALVAQGQRPFLDYLSLYPPGFAFIGAAFLKVGFAPWALTWLLPLSWAAGVALMSRAFWLRLNAGGRAEAWLVAAAFPLFCIDFGGNHATLELGVAFFGLATACALEGSGARRFGWAGLCVGCAILVKQVGVLFLLPVLVQVSSLEALGALAVGVLVPLLGCLAWLRFDVARIAASIETLQGYVVSTTPQGLSAWRHAGVELVKRELTRTPPSVVLFVAIALLAALALRRLSSTREWRRAATLAAWGVVGAAFLGARLVNDFPHYTINCWPALVVIAGTAREVLYPGVARLRIAAAVALLATVALFVRAPVTDMRGAPYWSRWAGESQLATFLKPIADELRRTLPPAAHVSQLGLEESVLLFIAGRTPLNRDWAGYDLGSPIEGDAIVFTDYRQASAAARRAQIIEHGYERTRVWTAVWGSVELYAKNTEGH